MERIKLQPFTETEKRFSEENHNIIYKYLHTHNYNLEDFYSIAVIGYLKAVQIYFRRKDLQEKYKFYYIACQYMRAEISNSRKQNIAQKRIPVETIISLDAEGNFHNCIIGKSLEDEWMESELLEELLENLSEVQRDILKLRLEGFSNKEIFLELEIPVSTYYKEFNKIKSTFNGMIGENYHA